MCNKWKKVQVWRFSLDICSKGRCYFAWWRDYWMSERRLEYFDWLPEKNALFFYFCCLCVVRSLLTKRLQQFVWNCQDILKSLNLDFLRSLKRSGQKLFHESIFTKLLIFPKNVFPINVKFLNLSPPNLVHTLTVLQIIIPENLSFISLANLILFALLYSFLCDPWCFLLHIRFLIVIHPS